MLKNLEDSDDVKVGVTELQKQLEISEEVGIYIRQVAQQAMCENGQKIFELYRQGEEEVCIACLARCNAQVKGFVELERRFRNTMQEVQVLSEIQEEIFKKYDGRRT